MGAFGAGKAKDEIKTLSDELANLFDVQNRFANTDMSKLTCNLNIVKGLNKELEGQYESMGDVLAERLNSTIFAQALESINQLGLLNKSAKINEAVRKSLEEQTAELEAQAIYFDIINKSAEIQEAIQKILLRDIREETAQQDRLNAIRLRGYQQESSHRNRALILTQAQERQQALIYEFVQKGVKEETARAEAIRRTSGETDLLLRKLEDATDLSQEKFIKKIGIELEVETSAFTEIDAGRSITRALESEIDSTYEELEKLDESKRDAYFKERQAKIREKYSSTFETAIRQSNKDIAGMEVGEFGYMNLFSDEINFFDTRTQELVIALRNRAQLIEQQEVLDFQTKKAKLEGDNVGIEIETILHNNRLDKIREQATAKELALMKRASRSKMMLKRMELMASAQMILGGLEQLNSATEAKNKKEFEAQKRFSLGVATINTALAVTMALSDPKQKSMLMKFAMASTALIAGIAQVKAIKSTQYGGGGELSASSMAQGITFSDSESSGARTDSGSEASAGAGAVGRRNTIQPNVVLNVQNNLDRSGLYTLVQEGYDEISTRAIATT
jgi:hypothetical protein